jgi:hypothetical protein
MQTEGQVKVISIEGLEPTTIELEEYANFLRDLVFIHDRVSLISQKGNFPTSLYYSSFFYVRDRQRVSHPLQLVSARIGSPWKLDLDINVGEWFKDAGTAFLDLLRGIVTLPSYIEREKQIAEQEKLKTRQMRARTQVLESVAREARLAIERPQVPELIAENSPLHALNTNDDPEWQAKLKPLRNDLQRLSDSPLRMTSIKDLQEGSTQVKLE